jgi:putative Mn2+ efflux pump MntP
MATYEVVLLAFALSIDAFAVSLVAAATGRLNGGRAGFRLAFHFGLPWVIAFRMIRSSIAGTWPERAGDSSRGLTMLALALATSIDALAVGFSMAILHINILWPSVLIGTVTAGVCLLAILLGSRLEARLGRWAA